MFIQQSHSGRMVWNSESNHLPWTNESTKYFILKYFKFDIFTLLQVFNDVFFFFIFIRQLIIITKIINYYIVRFDLV